MKALENPCRRLSPRNHSLVRLVHFYTLPDIYYHSAPLLPTLCPDCSLVPSHVKRNVSQNEIFFFRARAPSHLFHVFHFEKPLRLVEGSRHNYGSLCFSGSAEAILSRKSKQKKISY